MFRTSRHWISRPLGAHITCERLGPRRVQRSRHLQHPPNLGLRRTRLCSSQSDGKIRTLFTTLTIKRKCSVCCDRLAAPKMSSTTSLRLTPLWKNKLTYFSTRQNSCVPGWRRRLFVLFPGERFTLDHLAFFHRAEKCVAVRENVDVAQRLDDHLCFRVFKRQPTRRRRRHHLSQVCGGRWCP